RKGDRYILNGSKMFITQGTVAGTYVITAVTEKTNGKNKISAFILEPGTKGFRIGKKENKLGMRASDTAELIFENAEIPAENLIGKEHEGFKQVMKILDGGRIAIAALALGVAQGALDASIKYSKQRKQFGKFLSDFQATQFKIAELATEIDAARLLVMKAASMKDAGEVYSNESSMAKLFASEAAVRATNEAVQIHGGYGFIKEFPVEKLYRDVKLLTIGEGTSEVQRMIIARNLINLF
ncbi:MAG: acyl-CoA dehydrogenase family protein, partial [Ignavibacteria bacterium]|nr:acyl-CoA dehydrogenase family protein [Ignavibacteria bacterium]